MPIRSATTKRVIKGVPSSPGRRPSVTAVIPSYNYGRFLRDSVGSILAQEGVDIRVVVVDDGSTDDTELVLRELAEADERVLALRNEPNAGQLPSVNRGLQHVESEYVMKFDADDLLAPGALQRATALLDAHSDVSFVYGRPHHFEGSVPTVPAAPTKSWSIWDGWDWVAERCRAGTNVISQPEAVMRTSALRAAGGVREDLPHTFDFHLWMRLATLGRVGRVNGPVQGLYRVHSASLQRTVHSGVLLDLTARRDAFDALFAAVGECGNAANSTARRTLAAEALARISRAYDRGRTASEPIDALRAFAIETSSDARSLREWSAVQRREAVGAQGVPRRPRYLAASVKRKTLEEASRRRWLRTGEW